MFEFVSEISAYCPETVVVQLKSFEAQISELGQSVEFFAGSGLNRILLVFTVQARYSDEGQLSKNGYHQNRVTRRNFPYPAIAAEDKEIYNEQHLKIMTFQARLDLLIKKTEFPVLPDGKGYDFLLLYNQKCDELKQQQTGRNDKTNNKSEDEKQRINFVVTPPRYTLSRIVLNKDLLHEIDNVLATIRCREKIYDDWGFSEVDAMPRAVLNFYGPSGTGKTMTAHAIAAKLNCPILAVSYAEIESKYVGDAPKNMVAAFAAARKENALLFFDEADSFLGKRITNVSSSSDQAVNSLRSQLLMLLEGFEGIVVFATNLLANYDKAFESRILRHLKFDLPDKEARCKIIDITIPGKLPFRNEERISEAQINQLAELAEGFSGRHIKNAVLATITQAAASGAAHLIFDDFLSAFGRYQQSLADISQETGKLPLSSGQIRKIENEIAISLKENDNVKIVNDEG